MKIDTFNFTKYGLIHGNVISVSQDSIKREKADGTEGDSTRRVARMTERRLAAILVSDVVNYVRRRVRCH